MWFKIKVLSQRVFTPQAWMVNDSYIYDEDIDNVFKDIIADADNIIVNSDFTADYKDLQIWHVNRYYAGPHLYKSCKTLIPTPWTARKFYKIIDKKIAEHEAKQKQKEKQKILENGKVKKEKK